MSMGMVRKLLRENPEGMTARELATAIYADASQQAPVNKSIAKMPDVYRDRWVRVPGVVRYVAVYCAVDVPEDCPHPRKTK